MNRIDLIQQGRNLFFFLILQLPLLFKFVLFDKAFGFFYVGFLLLLPFSISVGLSLVVAFFAGLLVDIFCNTPGIHAGASVLVVYIRVFWFKTMVDDDLDENANVNWNNLGLWGAFKYITPLVLIHHTALFVIENGGFFHGLLGTIVFSTIYSSLLIFGVSFLIAPRRSRS